MVSIQKPEEIPVKKFEIDKPYLRENLKNHPLKDWFFKKFNTEEKDKMRELWYFQMEEEERNIPFFY